MRRWARLCQTALQSNRAVSTCQAEAATTSHDQLLLGILGDGRRTHDSAQVAGSLQQLWQQAQQTGDSELAAEVLRTMQLCGLGQAAAGSRADAVSSARASLGLAAVSAQPAAHEWDQGSAAPAQRSSNAAAAPVGSGGNALSPVLAELRSLREAADLGGLRRAWGDWQLAQLQQRRRDLLAELEVASYYTQALAGCARARDGLLHDAAAEVGEALQQMVQLHRALGAAGSGTSSSGSSGPLAAASAAGSGLSPSQLLLKSFNRALKLQCQLARHEQVAALLQQMHSCGLAPDAVSYEVLLTSAVMRGHPPAALEALLHEMLGFGLLPSAAHMDQLLVAYARYGDAAGARAVLQRMALLGLAPATRQYNHVLQACAYARDLDGAAAVYEELRAAQLAPDVRTFDRLFCAVRLAAEGARMEAARALHQLAAGDWAQRREVLGVRSARFNGVYVLLSRWQRHMVEARLQHSERSLLHLARALERLNRMGDCLQLVQAYEQLRPGETRPHSAAIAVGGRASAPRSVSYCLQLVQQLEARRGRLGARDYLALMAAQGWLHRDVGRVHATLARMKAAGHSLDGSAYEAVVQVFCRLGKWAEAEGAVREMLARGLAPQDSLWHVCLRHLVWAEAPREVCDAFLGLMPPQARHRFEALYSLGTRAAGDGGGGGEEQADEEEAAQEPVAAVA